MTNCNQKVSITCGTEIPATCVPYRTDLPEFSELACPTIEETTAEIYETIQEIKNNSDLSSLRGNCITYPQGNITIMQAFISQQNYICTLNETIEEMQTTISTMQQQIQDLQQNNCP